MLGDKLGNVTGKVVLRRVLPAGQGAIRTERARSAEPELCWVSTIER